MHRLVAAYLEEAGLVASSQGGFAQAATQQLTVAEADVAILGAHVLHITTAVHLLLRLQVHVHPACQKRTVGTAKTWHVWESRRCVRASRVCMLSLDLVIEFV